MINKSKYSDPFDSQETPGWIENGDTAVSAWEFAIGHENLSRALVDGTRQKKLRAIWIQRLASLGIKGVLTI